MTNQKMRMSFTEFVALAASLTAFVALSTDAILPALGEIGRDLASEDPNAQQLTISMFFFGLAISQFLFGPVADSFGRKRAIYIGLSIFLVGTVMCLFADSLWTLIVGRIVQGIGAAGPRIAANAMVRDRFSGREMARVQSLVMTLFVVVPVFAPLIGQAIMFLGGWLSIFLFLGLCAIGALIWSALRMEETLHEAHRAPFRPAPIMAALRIVVSNRVAMACTLAMGFVFAAFIAFLGSSQQLMGEAYGLGPWFPLAFSVVAILIGVSSAVNSQLVMRLGMERLSTIGIVTLGLSSLAFCIWFWIAGDPPIWAAGLWLAVAAGSIGILFSNLNSMAMEPLGEVAGVAAGVVASVSSVIASVVGTLIGQQYDGTGLPIALGFFGCAVISLVLLRWASIARKRDGLAKEMPA